VQVHIADCGVTLPKLDPDIREQTGGGHATTSLGKGLSAGDYAWRSGRASPEVGDGPALTSTGRPSTVGERSHQPD
jgi:hypothetical protein